MNGRILVVDDEPNLLELVRFTVELAGYSVTTAGTGAAALKQVSIAVPDLLILDMMLPDISGAEVCLQLRALPQTAALPIIMLSARAQVMDKVRGLRAGADDYLTKPIDGRELTARIEALLGRSRPSAAGPGRKARTLCFIGAKGGVGVTTVTLNLATLLAQKSASVLAVELRPHFGTFRSLLARQPRAHLAQLLALEPQRIGERELEEHIVALPSGLRLLLGPQAVEDFQAVSPAHAEAILSIAARQFSQLLVDLPSQPSSGSQAAVHLADFVALVLEPEPSSMLSARLMLEQLRAWGVGDAALGAVLVRRGTSGPGLSLAEIRTELGCELVGVVPPAAEAMAMALRQAVPVVQSQPQSTVAMALNELAGSLAAQPVRLMNVA